MEKIRFSMQSWLGHIMHADSYRLSQEILSNVESIFNEGGTESKGPARGLVEQQS